MALHIFYMLNSHLWLVATIWGSTVKTVGKIFSPSWPYALILLESKHQAKTQFNKKT